VPDSGESLAEEVLRRLGYDDEAAPEFTEFALSFFAQNKNKSGLPTETSWNGLTMVDIYRLGGAKSQSREKDVWD